MRRPVVGEVYVHYGQIYVESDRQAIGPALAEAFGGQSGGLCGAATPGALWLTSGLRTGNVGFTVEVHDQAPQLDPEWEEVVEVSFRPASARSVLAQWAGEGAWELGLDEVDYRARYCASGMDEARRQDTRLAGPRWTHYLLQFWPAPPARDEVLKQTSSIAAYWHDSARRLPPPPTPAERAEAERLARIVQEQAVEEVRLAREKWEWGVECRATRCVMPAAAPGDCCASTPGSSTHSTPPAPRGSAQWPYSRLAARARSPVSPSSTGWLQRSSPWLKAACCHRPSTIRNTCGKQSSLIRASHAGRSAARSRRSGRASDHRYPRPQACRGLSRIPCHARRASGWVGGPTEWGRRIRVHGGHRPLGQIGTRRSGSARRILPRGCRNRTWPCPR